MNQYEVTFFRSDGTKVVMRLWFDDESAKTCTRPIKLIKKK